ncbi:helix-turn-helix domain-containing protein [Kineosporia babensis]|uniref:Helix-turn-helix transcriptional regulator n=1 Tax=Kineosporia babensis TaxID=499548 RepID=A0A9X1NJS0_9ACTN|nr:helix-turn-helix transcriptional regulator [Kineosporia babensis]MCD5314986.1 helix-turn-helix transcriptional regulator [Kineosporia babensis]
MAKREARESELGAYLRARRAQVEPESIGLPRGRRRVTGLRREEVATLAGVSVDYYTRLEQGRERHPSPQLLQTLSRALELNADESVHLHRLATDESYPVPSSDERSVADGLLRLMERWPLNPAFVYDDAQNILAANSLGQALHSGFARPDNFARMIFLDPAGRSFFAEWDKVAQDTVGSLRQAWGKPASRPGISRVVEELSTLSNDFERLWTSQAVIGKIRHTKNLDHPTLGELTLEYLGFDLPDVPGQHLLICDAQPNSASEQKLQSFTRSTIS